MDWLRTLGMVARVLVRKRSFALSAILLMALGVALSTTAFTVLDQLLWGPLPGVPRGDRLVTIYGTDEASDAEVAPYAALGDIAARSRSLAAVAAFKPWLVELETKDEGEPVATLMVSGEFFRLLGLRPVVGRFFIGREAEERGSAIVVLGHDLWQRRFAGRSDIVGRSVSVDGLACTVIGVTPPGFRGTSGDMQAELFVPIGLQPHLMGRDLLDSRGWSGVLMLGRLKDGVTLVAAAADLRQVAESLARDYPESHGEQGLMLEPLGTARVSAFARATWERLGLLVAVAAGLVLLLACANVANLLSARAMARREEMALRQAIGAGPARLARDLLLEHALLAALGGAAGALLALATLAGLRLLPSPLPPHVRLDTRALVAAIVVTALTALVVSALPVLETRRHLSGRLRRGEQPGAARARRALVAAQVTIALVLLVGAGLFGRTLLNLQAAPLGFAPEPLLAAELGISGDLEPGEVTARWQTLIEAVETLPGVQRAALSTRLPGFADEDTVGAALVGPQGREELSLSYQAIGAGYFNTLGVPLVGGRELNAADERLASPVAIVNESFARRHWPGRAAIGETVELLGDRSVTVVGVVRNSVSGRLQDAAQPLLYLPWAGFTEPPRSLRLLVRTSGDPAAMVTPLRDLARARGVARVRAVKPLADQLVAATGQERIASTMLASLSGVALALTALGLYSLLSWSLAQRQRELGVRSALGADGARLRREVLGGALRLTATGVMLGALAAVGAAQGLRRLLFEVPPHDPLTILGAAALLLATAALAAWGPARRASRVDPATVLRES